MNAIKFNIVLNIIFSIKHLHIKVRYKASLMITVTKHLAKQGNSKHNNLLYFSIVKSPNIPLLSKLIENYKQFMICDGDKLTSARAETCRRGPLGIPQTTNYVHYNHFVTKQKNFFKKIVVGRYIAYLLKQYSNIY
jgi:hypothetical protein